MDKEFTEKSQNSIFIYRDDPSVEEQVTVEEVFEMAIGNTS